MRSEHSKGTSATTTAQSTLADPLDVRSPTALAYETTEEARLLLGDADNRLAEARTAAGEGASAGDLTRARAAAGEAAYYLSDTIEPDERIGLLALAGRRSKPLPPDEEAVEIRATEALALLADAAGEVEQMLRGSSASAELRIALRALRRAIGILACHFGLAVNHVNVNNLRSQRPSVLRRLHPRHR